jgi:hypothetical protein
MPDGAYGTLFSIPARPAQPSPLPVHLAAAPWAVWLPPTAAAQLFDTTKLFTLDFFDKQVLPGNTWWLQLYNDPLEPTEADLQRAVSLLELASTESMT